MQEDARSRPIVVGDGRPPSQPGFVSGVLLRVTALPLPMDLQAGGSARCWQGT